MPTFKLVDVSPQQEKLATLCQKLGGQLRLVNWCDFNQPTRFFDAPFTNKLGVDWHRKIIYADPSTKPADIIHEMGHVFASKVNPARSEEYSFLGWEYVVSMSIGMTEPEWTEQMKEYMVTDQYTLLDVFHGTDGLLWEVFRQEWLTTARAHGLIDDQQQPLTIRRCKKAA